MRESYQVVVVGAGAYLLCHPFGDPPMSAIDHVKEASKILPKESVISLVV